MAGRNPTAAVKAFVAPIKGALGLFASGNVTADSYKPDVEGVLTFNGGEVVKLRGGNKVGLSVSMRYCIVKTDEPGRGPWKVTTVGYMYELQTRRQDAVRVPLAPDARCLYEPGPSRTPAGCHPVGPRGINDE